MKHGDLLYVKDGAKARLVHREDGETELQFYRGKVPQVYCGGCWRVVRPKLGKCPNCHRKFP